MTFKDDSKKEIKKMDEKIDNISSFAFKIIKEAKRDKTFWFVTWLITFLALSGSIIYIIYLNGDIDTTVTDTIDIQDVQNIDNSHIKIGDDVWEKSN